MLKIKVINKSKNPLPKYQTAGASGLDLHANVEEPIILKKNDIVLVPTGLYIEIPEGYEAQVRSRSSLALKHGIFCLNSPATIDSDYRGEIKIILASLSEEPFTINFRDRIAQIVFAKVEKAEFEEVESVYGERERELKKAVLTLDANVESALDDFKFNEALSYIWEVIRMTNKYVEESAPWNLAKDETKKDYLANVMYISFQSYYIITAYLQIFFVETPKKVFNRLGLGDNVPLDNAKKWGSLNAGIKIERGEALFKRYDIEEEIGIKTKENKKEVNPPKDEKHKPNIEKEEFEKLELLTAKILFAEKVENADKLIKFVVDIGEGEQRVVVSSIAEYYKAEDMVGKTVLYLANLKPKKFRGIISHGMLLLADNGETLSIMKAEKDFEAGCEVK